jgi:hypothetical protein
MSSTDHRPAGITGDDRPASDLPAAGRSATESRSDRFAREVAELKIPDPSAGRGTLWLRVGMVTMILGPILGLIAYFMSHGTADPLVQRDAIVIALIGVSISIVGAAVFLRFSITGFLRFWMARQTFDLNQFAERVSTQTPDNGR